MSRTSAGSRPPLPEHPPVARPPVPSAPSAAVSPDLAARAAALRDRSGTRHPAQGARAAALVASVASTVGVALALTVADRPPATTTSTVATGAASSSAATSSSSSATSSSAAAAPAATTAAQTPTTTATTVPAARYANGVWTGTAEYTKWGNVQVRATITNGKLTDVTAVQTPTDRKSANINAQAQPILESEAIAQQDASLDMVSGATYTSRTYTASLQAALDQAAAAVARSSVQTS